MATLTAFVKYLFLVDGPVVGASSACQLAMIFHAIHLVGHIVAMAHWHWDYD